MGAGGNVEISGGEITATGGSKYNAAGAGIGTGSDYYESTGGGTIKITGGSVNATGGAIGGAGIGGGRNTPGISVEISGGDVETNGGDSAKGIGAGKERTIHGSLTITGLGTTLHLYGDDATNPPVTSRGGTSDRYKYMDVSDYE